MPATINAIPWGILGFLGIKNGGLYPQALAETLAPTWDMRDFYLSHQAEISGLVGAVGVTGFAPYLTVPAGQVWAVSNMSVAVTTGAGEAHSGVIALRANGTGETVNLSALDTLAASVTGSMQTCQPLVLASGVDLGLLTYSVTGTPATYFTARFTRLSM